MQMSCCFSYVSPQMQHPFSLLPASVLTMMVTKCFPTPLIYPHLLMYSINILYSILSIFYHKQELSPPFFSLSIYPFICQNSLTDCGFLFFFSFNDSLLSLIILVAKLSQIWLVEALSSWLPMLHLMHSLLQPWNQLLLQRALVPISREQYQKPRSVY